MMKFVSLDHKSREGTTCSTQAAPTPYAVTHRGLNGPWVGVTSVRDFTVKPLAG